MTSVSALSTRLKNENKQKASYATLKNDIYVYIYIHMYTHIYICIFVYIHVYTFHPILISYLW